MRKKILVLFSLVFWFSLCSGCAENMSVNELLSEFKSFPKEPNFASEGVVVYGYGKSWIQNTNEYPVRIQRVGRGYRNCDSTKWVQTFEAGQIKKGYVYIRERLYIYNLDGKPIGFIYIENPIKKK